MSTIPLIKRGNPKNVLIVGGGDGAVLREVLQYPGVQKVVICEFDQVHDFFLPKQCWLLIEYLRP